MRIVVTFKLIVNPAIIINIWEHLHCQDIGSDKESLTPSCYKLSKVVESEKDFTFDTLLRSVMEQNTTSNKENPNYDHYNIKRENQIYFSTITNDDVSQTLMEATLYWNVCGITTFLNYTNRMGENSYKIGIEGNIFNTALIWKAFRNLDFSLSGFDKSNIIITLEGKPVIAQKLIKLLYDLSVVIHDHQTDDLHYCFNNSSKIGVSTT